jgi:hypothetical protein
MYFSEHMEIGMYLIMTLITRAYICSTTELFSLIGELGQVDCDAMRDSFRPSLGICNGISDRRVAASVAMQVSLIRYNISQIKCRRPGKPLVSEERELHVTIPKAASIPIGRIQRVIRISVNDPRNRLLSAMISNVAMPI